MYTLCKPFFTTISIYVSLNSTVCEDSAIFNK